MRCKHTDRAALLQLQRIQHQASGNLLPHPPNRPNLCPYPTQIPLLQEERTPFILPIRFLTKLTEVRAAQGWAAFLAAAWHLTIGIREQLRDLYT